MFDNQSSRRKTLHLEVYFALVKHILYNHRNDYGAQTNYDVQLQKMIFMAVDDVGRYLFMYISMWTVKKNFKQHGKVVFF